MKGLRVALIMAMLLAVYLGITSTGCAQNQGVVYPTGFVLIYRNERTPFRWVQRWVQRNNQRVLERVRVNINYNMETIQFVLIIRGSDGNYYTNFGGTGNTEYYRPEDGWIIMGTGIPVEDYARFHTVLVRDWLRLPTNRRVALDVRWYGYAGSRVDRETRKTTTVSPPLNYVDPGGRDRIRYYLVDIEQNPGSGNWGKRRINLSDSGGIIAPMIRISWRDPKSNSERVEWFPSQSSGLAPLPGLNDCARRSSTGACIESINTPTDASFNQYWSNRTWDYNIYFSASLINPQYPVQYPVFVMHNVGAITGGHSDRGIVGDVVNYNISYDTPRWWRIQRATIWLNVPYEWGGKFFGARASGQQFNYNLNGSGTTSGFGLDCSGLVAVAKGSYRAYYYGVGAVVNETRWLYREVRSGGRVFRVNDWASLRPGDVIVRHPRNSHVMILYRISNTAGLYTYHYIESYGASSNNPGASEERVRYRTGSASSFDLDGFEPRAFND